MRWIRQGECKRCGRCCKADNLLGACNWLEKTILFFVILSKSKTKTARNIRGLKGFECPHLMEIGGKHVCLNYENRPDFCQKFPASPKDLILDKKGNNECGFWFIHHGDNEGMFNKMKLSEIIRPLEGGASA